jgi:hypothetical protein
LKNEFLFPQIDAFKLEVSHDTLLCDTDKNVILLLTETPTEVVLGRRVFSLSKGNLLLALPHSYLRQKSDNSQFHGYQIAFPREAIRSFSNRLYLESADGGLAISASDTQTESLFSLVSKLYSGTLAPTYALPSILSVLEDADFPEPNTAFEIPLPKLLRRALCYIEENLSEELDSAELAARYSISQSTLLRLFRQYLATTPRKYAHALRELHK